MPEAMHSGGGVVARHFASPFMHAPQVIGRHSRRGRRPESVLAHAAQQLLAHDHIELRLLVGIEYRAHLEDVCNGLAVGLAHGVVKAINRSGKALALGVVLRHGRGNVARGRSQLSVKRGFARGVAGFNRLQTPVLFGRQIKVAVHGRIERVSMGFGARERCADKNAPEPCAESDERCQSEHLPGFQHSLSAERRSGSVGLIERKRPGFHRSGGGGGRYANGGADHKDEGADASDCAVGGSASPVTCARVNAGPDIALQPIQCCVDIHPAQSGELAIKVCQGSLRAITLSYTRLAMRALEQLAEGRVEGQEPDAEAARTRGVLDEFLHQFRAWLKRGIGGAERLGRAFAVTERLQLCARAPTPMTTRAMTPLSRPNAPDD